MVYGMRIRHCKKCGITFATDRRKVYLCPACSSVAFREHYIKDRICIVCKKTFPGNPSSKYCPACLVDHKREMNRKFKRTGMGRPIGSEDICISCGSKYIVTGSKQKWCKACAASAAKAARRAYDRKYRESNREYIDSYYAAMRVDSKACVVCGRPFGGRGPTVTCSDACAKEQLRIRQKRARANSKEKASTEYDEPHGG